MTDGQQEFTASAVDDAEKTGAERRVYPRVPLEFPARCLLPDGTECAARLRDISASGCYISVDTATELPALGERVVSYVDRLGRFEGEVKRLGEDGFAIAIDMTIAKRERFAETLKRIADGDQDALDDVRRHPRLDGDDNPTTLRMANGSIGSCRVIDMSLSGASVESHLRPTIGVFVDLGRMRGRVVRHHDNGFAVEFADVAPTPNALVQHFEAAHTP